MDYDLDYDHSLFGEIPDPCSEETTEAAAAPTAPTIEGGEAVKSQTASQRDDATAQSGENHRKSHGDSSGAGRGNAAQAGALPGGLSSAKARVAEAIAARAALAGLTAEEQQLQAGSHVRGGNLDGSNVGGTGGDPMRGHALEGGGLSEDMDLEGDEGEKLPLSQRVRVSIRRAGGADRHERSAASIKVLVQVLDCVGESQSSTVQPQKLNTLGFICMLLAMPDQTHVSVLISNTRAHPAFAACRKVLRLVPHMSLFSLQEACGCAAITNLAVFRIFAE